MRFRCIYMRCYELYPFSMYFMRCSMNSLPDSCWALRVSDEFSAWFVHQARSWAWARALGFGRQTSKKHILEKNMSYSMKRTCLSICWVWKEHIMLWNALLQARRFLTNCLTGRRLFTAGRLCLKGQEGKYIGIGEHLENIENCDFCTTWQLGGSGMVQNTPIRYGNRLPTRQAHFLKVPFLFDFV